MMVQTDYRAFAAAVHLHTQWIRDYIESGRLDEARECALGLDLRAVQMLDAPVSDPTAPAPPSTPLHLLNSKSAHELAETLRLAANCALAVDAERGVPTEGSFGAFLAGLAGCVEDEVYGPRCLRSLE